MGKHRISAGLIALDPQQRVALVRHCKPGVYDFWVAPGGGVEAGEELRAAARREALEETGLVVDQLTLIAIEQLFAAQSRTHHVKHWFFAEVDEARPMRVDSASADREFITAAAWLHRSEFDGRTIFPPILDTVFWQQHSAGFPSPILLDLRVMTFE